MTITLIPAYGRDYKNKQDVLNDFNKNLDFIIMDIISPWDQKPVNKQDLKQYENFFGARIISAKIRYNNLQKITIVDIK